jgi:ADP-heptose:LPS heptosyltransferase
MINNYIKKWILHSLAFTLSLLHELDGITIRILPYSVSKYEGSKRQLLIIRLDAIGDFVLFLDTFKEYRKLYPATEWEITLLANCAWSDLAKNLPYADRYWFIDRKHFSRNPIYRYRILRQVREAGFDTVIQPTFSREYAFGDAVVRASNAPARIGSSSNLINITARQKYRSDRWYTSLIPASDQPLNELARNAEFLRGLGLHEFKESAPVFPLELVPRLPRSFIIDTPYFVIFPGAGWVGRQWPVERFASVAYYLYRETGWTPVLCGGVVEESLAPRVISFAPTLPWRNIAGKTTLVQLVRILSSARMLIGNETSAIHLASAVGCSTVCIIGGGHFGLFFPYGNLEKNRIVYKKMDCFGCNWHCKHPIVRCVEEITVDNVWQEVCRILKAEQVTVCRTP